MQEQGFRDLARSSARWVTKWRHPLWWLPDVPSEQDESYHKIWSQLRQIRLLADGRHDTADFLSRPGPLIVVCVRIPADTLVPEFARLQDMLRTKDYVRLVPEPVFNITIQELGYLAERPSGRDEITRGWLDEYIEQAALSIRDFPTYDIQFGGANSYADAAFLDIHDGGWTSRIHDVLLDFVSNPPRTRFAYLPEFIVAQYVKTAPIGTLVHDLTPFRDISFGTLQATHVDILAFPIQSGFGDPEVIHTLELGQRRPMIERVQPVEPANRQAPPTGAAPVHRGPMPGIW